MRQITLASGSFETHRKLTRRELFLADMNTVVPWADLCALIEPFYPKGEHGRPPIGLERMLRIYFVQLWFNLSDPAAEEALYDSQAMRTFVGIDLGREPAPDETTILKFRHLLEEHKLGQQLFDAVGTHLKAQGLTVSRGTIVDATIIRAPSSTKNQDKKRDPAMHQTKKGNQWHFGMKAHIGVDSKTKIVHSVATTSANVHDAKVLADLLHGEETRVYGDSAYTGQKAVIHNHAPKAQDFTQYRPYRNRPLTHTEKSQNRTKSQIRAKVEHVFLVIKRLFGFTKVCYRGLAKNHHRLVVTCALANLYIVRRRLLRPLRI